MTPQQLVPVGAPKGFGSSLRSGHIHWARRCNSQFVNVTGLEEDLSDDRFRSPRSARR